MGTIDMPVCGKCKKNTAVRKMIRAPMVHFKGSGFYKTDSSGTAKAKPKDATQETPKPAETKPEVKATETKPIEVKSVDSSKPADQHSRKQP